MQTVTKIIYGDKYLQDLVKLAITVGTGAGSAVLFGGYIMVLIIIIE